MLKIYFGLRVRYNLAQNHQCIFKVKKLSILMLFVENSFKLRVRSNLAQYDHAVVVVGDEFCAVHRDV